MPRFVVHDHRARTHHYDVRLEHDGVLVSWAVPKGLPERAGERRLAIRTPDHPLEYIDFAGTIPAGSVRRRRGGRPRPRRVRPGGLDGGPDRGPAPRPPLRRAVPLRPVPARRPRPVARPPGAGQADYKRPSGLVGSMAGAYTTECPPGGEDAGSWIRRGMACTRRRKYSDAIGSFDRALEHEPELGRGPARAGERPLRARALRRGARRVRPCRGAALPIARPRRWPARMRSRRSAGSEEAAAAFARAMDLRRRPERG